MKHLLMSCALAATVFSACNTKQSTQQDEPSTKAENWIQLFNGKDLSGWTPKITGYPSGENFANTFRVEDGILKVCYDGYDEFNNRFGHLYTNKDYSHYKLRVEYRFTGDQLKGAPGWAIRNSGAMLHCPAPETMDLNQDFPVSLEAQMLGGDGVNERSTGNLCTPGTEVFIEKEQYNGHCASSTSKTYHGDQWVTMEMVMLGDSIAHHIIDGDTIITYSQMTYGGGNVSPDPGFVAGTPISKGRIALQSEGHPVEFRKVELLDLSDQYK
ncbi:MAG: 3-keto-disaccharide hydrolase [Tannerellaceae bacterium]